MEVEIYKERHKMSWFENNEDKVVNLLRRRDI